METEKLVPKSKINIAAAVMLVVNLLIIWEVIPPEYADKVMATVNTLGPSLIVYWRIWHTSSRLTWRRQ